ncbi:hypothetical protein WJU16_09625 [Chitinophaga pollutisoli]|uniref:Two component regulator propeller n=1 Tax=Chitinophaga pollutisoli TaxID=3133966 RepID=A0ABZ2YUV1_9BACT
MEPVTGSDGKDRLLALLTSSHQTLVYNIGTGQVEQEISGMDMKAVWNDRQAGQVYYTSQSSLKRFDPSAPSQSAETLATGVGTANAITKGKDGKIYLLTSGGVLVKYNPGNGKVERQKLDIPAQPIPINAILYGPDGKIWMGGYLAGGHAAYDPITGKTTRHPGLDQTESMVVKGKSIYLGIYPKGRFYVYDSEKPWDAASGNPRKLGAIEGQGRSFAMLDVPGHDLVVFGMIPEYGKLGGALVTYHSAKDQLVSHGAVVPSQAIASLVMADSLVLGGTTISGGLGIRPAAREAVIFGWNVRENKKEFEVVPVPGAAAVTCMIQGPDGNVWGIAGGVLFIFDTGKREVIASRRLFEVPPLTSHVWRGATMVLHPSGDVYGTGNDQLFRIDGKTHDFTVLAKGASLLAMDKDGHLYFRKARELWRYTIEK